MCLLCQPRFIKLTAINKGSQESVGASLDAMPVCRNSYVKL
jgi:hypothetical protein